jgi:hypothetical protein
MFSVFLCLSRNIALLTDTDLGDCIHQFDHFEWAFLTLDKSKQYLIYSACVPAFRLLLHLRATFGL